MGAAYDYWSAARSSLAADTLLKRIFEAVELLETYPGLGRRGRIPGTREFVLAPLPFVVAYRARRGEIEIVALLHSARKWPGQF